MGVRRAHHARIDLPGEIHVVGVAAGAAQKPVVLFARDRLADH
jgi:hypothetical protein